MYNVLVTVVHVQAYVQHRLCVCVTSKILARVMYNVLATLKHVLCVTVMQKNSTLLSNNFVLYYIKNRIWMYFHNQLDMLLIF